MQTYYQILGINPDATEKEVKSAFRQLARKHHPDVKGDPAKFREIYEAYEVLMDPKKRAAYDSTGHERYTKEKSHTEGRYPSYEEIFKEAVLKAISTQTLVDRFVPGYPSAYIGGEGFEDPHTGDIYYSAEDIRIAKMERANEIYKEQMEKIRQSLYGGIPSLEKLRMLAGALFNMKWLTEEELNKSLELIDEYEIKDKEWRKEQAVREKAREVGDPIQEKIEKEENAATKEKEAQSTNRMNKEFIRSQQLHKKGFVPGEDPDKRKEWRKETKRIR